LVDMQSMHTEELQDVSRGEEQASALTDLVIITGFSGAGKSTAMAVFEDEGYFCVDNLPSEMIRSLVDLFRHTGSKVAKAAVVSDVRGGSYFEGLAEMLGDLRETGVSHRVLFLAADEQTLMTRYKELRPLTGDDPRIVEFINRDGELDEFYVRLHPLLDYLLPQYLVEGKAHLVVAIGCTGGRHRSVAIADHLAGRYGDDKDYLVEVVHRDVSRPI